jgi:hypothetical protein
MRAVGIIIHHSACPAINGKGFDYLILKNGSIIPASQPTEPGFIHICLEGDFSDRSSSMGTDSKEQLFLLLKLADRLSRLMNFSIKDIYPHSVDCPGKFFPWSQLVISDKDGYH